MKDNDQTIEALSKQADDIFFAAIEFETVAERDAFIENACAGDEALRQEIDQLFESVDDAEEFFADHMPTEIPVKDLVDTLSDLLAPFENTKSPLSGIEETGK